MRDAIELEFAGIPSVAIIHEAMKGSADAMRRISGVPDYDFITFNNPPSPNVVLTDEEVKAIAEELAPQIIERLTKKVA